MCAATAERFGCAICFPPGDPQAAHQQSRHLNELARLVDDSHLLVAIRECPHCGQRFVFTFTELIDWIDGDDPQRCSLLPITRDEADRLTALGEQTGQDAVESLSTGRPVLVMDFPKSGEQTFGYVAGARVVGPHD